MASTKLHAASLPRLLSLLPKNGVSAWVYQTRWEAKNLPVPSPLTAAASLDQSCRWVVEKVNLGVSDEGKPWAKAFGVLYWKGKPARSALEEAISEKANPDSRSLRLRSARREARHARGPGREDLGREQVPVDERGPAAGAGQDCARPGCDGGQP